MRFQDDLGKSRDPCLRCGLQIGGNYAADPRLQFLAGGKHQLKGIGNTLCGGCCTVRTDQAPREDDLGLAFLGGFGSRLTVLNDYGPQFSEASLEGLAYFGDRFAALAVDLRKKANHE